MIPGVSGKTEEQVAEEAKWAAYYNAGSAALIVLLLLVGTGTCILLRLRRKSRIQRGNSAPFLPVSTDDQDAPNGGTHEMDRFIDRTRSAEDDADGETTYSDDTYRMDATTASNTRANGRRLSPVLGYTDDDEGEPGKASRNARQAADADSVSRRDNEQIFDVGEEESDDESPYAPSHARGHGDAVRFA
jgi:carboxypeptidase D